MLENAIKNKLWIGIRCLGTLWLVKMIASFAKAITLLVYVILFMLESGSFSEYVPKATFVQAGCKAIFAFLICYYLICKGRWLYQFLWRNISMSSGCENVTVRVFTLLWGVELCLSSFCIFIISPIPVIILQFTSHWHTVDPEIRREFVVSCFAMIPQGLAYLVLGLILCKKYNTIAAFILRRVTKCSKEN